MPKAHKRTGDLIYKRKQDKTRSHAKSQGHVRSDRTRVLMKRERTLGQRSSLALLLFYPLGILHVTQKNPFCSKCKVRYLNPVEDAAVARLHSQAEGVLADSPGLRENEIKREGRGAGGRTWSG